MDPVEFVERTLEGLVKKIEAGKGFIEAEVDLENLEEAARRLKEAGLDHVKSLTVTDYKDRGVFRVVYHASSYLNEELAGYIIGLAVEVPRNNPEVPTLTYVWRSVEFQEREVYEMFGINFKNHPDLRLLLLTPQIAELKPLTKDFVVKEEPVIRAKPPTGTGKPAGVE
ncbi:MAG: NADH-quinone oxidoreductase subunit C [Desulfurococcales archaeon]|nr:NADH-quinone oxidoreductase subunit C [Desulfurococcales archaeon]